MSSTTPPRAVCPRQSAWSRRLATAALCIGLIGHAAAAQWAGGPDTEVNTANQAELEQVKGVGPQLSTRILAERIQAPFRDWADLQARLKGIGPAKAQRLSDAGLTVQGRHWPAAPASSASR